MSVSNDVVWMLTKKQNNTLVKFNGEQFSSNPYNLTNLHNAAHSGASNQYRVAVQA